MAMETDPIQTTTTVVNQQPIICNLLWGERLVVDVTSRSYEEIKVEVETTPYREDGTPPVKTFASQSIKRSTKNAVAAAQYVPEIGVAIMANEAAIPAMEREIQRREATLATAQATLTAAQTAEADAMAARNVAFAGRSGVDDPAWLAADAAWTAAKTATATAADRVKVATAAADDVANPPLS